MNSYAQAVYDAARKIPAGRVVSYGRLGAYLLPPLSGRIVGRMMAQCDEDIPWWRIVAKSGHFPIGKRDPSLAKTQKEMLAEEGVETVDGKIDMRRYECTVEELDLIL